MKPWEEDDTFLTRWMSGELSPGEIQQFESSDEYKNFEDVLNSFEDFESPAYNLPREMAKIKARVHDYNKKKSKVIKLRSVLYFAAAASIILFIGFGFLTDLFTSSSIEVVAESKQKVDLPDSSIVKINEGSSISYNTKKWSESRVVKLKGEAFFNVKQGNKFEVVVEKGKITVLGTSFNVKESEKMLEVTCFNGKVKVEVFSDLKILEAGDIYSFRKGKLPEKDSTILEEPVWWGEVVKISNKKLSLAVAKLKEIYEIKIIGDFNDSLIVNCAFPVNDIEVAIKQIFDPFDIQYRWDDEQKTIFIE